MTKRLSAAALLLAALLWQVAHAQDLSPSRPATGPVAVLAVVDGDTLVLESNVGPRTVRLIGIDTPEVSDGPRGAEARERLYGLVAGRQLWVEVGQDPEDRYSRLLAYLYFEDPQGRWDLGGVRATQVNLAMVEAGWADTLTIAPNTVYAPLYAAARDDAAARGLGFWAREGGADDLQAAPGAPDAPRLHCALVNPSTPEDEAGEWVSVFLDRPTDTTGYYLWDEGSGATFRLPDGLQPAGELRVPNPGKAAWNNGGDTIYLMREGRVVDAWTYGEAQGRRQDHVFCREAR
jgi:endonuclease YncB( thermonuclease family)